MDLNSRSCGLTFSCPVYYRAGNRLGSISHGRFAVAPCCIDTVYKNYQFANAKHQTFMSTEAVDRKYAPHIENVEYATYRGSWMVVMLPDTNRSKREHSKRLISINSNYSRVYSVYDRPVE